MISTHRWAACPRGHGWRVLDWTQCSSGRAVIRQRGHTILGAPQMGACGWARPGNPQGWTPGSEAVTHGQPHMLSPRKSYGDRASLGAY